MRLCVIHNPNSGLNRKTDRFNESILEGILRRHNADGFVVRTENTDEDVYRAAERCKKEEVSLVCINGGDGTNVHVLTQLKKVYGNSLPAILPMRGGTMNNLAWCHNIRTDPARILERIITLEEVVFAPQHIVHVHDAENNEDYYGTAFAASPAVARFLREYYSADIPGLPDIARIIKDLLVSKEYRANYKEMLPANVIVDDERLQHDEYLLLIASALPRIADYLNVFPFMDGNNRGKMHLVGLHEAVAPSMKYVVKFAVAGVLNYAFKRPLVNPKGNFINKCIKTMMIESPAGIPYVLDSEFLPETRKLEISADTEIMIPRVYR